MMIDEAISARESWERPQAYMREAVEARGVGGVGGVVREFLEEFNRSAFGDDEKK